MATRLGQMNGALDLLGQSHLATVGEEGKARRALDGVWTESVDFMLEQGFWNFAIRTSELTNDADVEPLFGYTYAFAEPDDYVQLISISSDERFTEELEDYEVGNLHWHCDFETIYLRYISDDETYGYDLGRWPQTYAMAHQAYIAFKSGLPISGDKQNRNDIFGLHEKWLARAKIKDALPQKVSRKPMGAWTSSRFVNRSNRER